jgi:hypothetical protein
MKVKTVGRPAARGGVRLNRRLSPGRWATGGTWKRKYPPEVASSVRRLASLTVTCGRIGFQTPMMTPIDSRLDTFGV